MKKWLFLLLIFLPVVCLFGATTGKITGRVIDETTGEPLPFANVMIEGTTLGAATDIDGHYFILNVPPGEYTLSALMMGYNYKKVKEVRVSVGFTTVCNFELPPTILEREEIVVTAERKIIRPDLTSSLAIVSARDIETMPVQNFRDILSLQAGVVKGHIRGGRSGEVAYLIDGVSVTDAYSGDIALEVDNAAIQELQLVSGAFNAEYGQAMSGVVNIVTKEGAKIYSGGVTTWFGDYLTGDKKFTGLARTNIFQNRNLQTNLSGPVPFLNRRATFFVTARYYHSDGWLYGERRVTPDGKPADSKLIPMNFYSNLFAQGKLSFQIRDDLELNYSHLRDDAEYNSYNHYFKYNPDGDLNRFSSGYNHQLSLTHMITPSTFYRLNLSRFFSQYKHYVYQNPLDPRYVHPDLMTAPAFSFAEGGTNMHHFTRWSRTTVGKFDITSQIGLSNEVKGGIELRRHNLFLHEFNIIPKRTEIGEIVPFEPEIPSIRSPGHNRYNKRPYEFSGYIQNKIELRDMIVNLGVRFDYFEPDGVVLADPSDPNIHDPWKAEHKAMTMEEREAIWWKRASAKTQISPRLGIAYPITDRGVIHFSYGHFLQIPPFEYLYRNPEFEVPKVSGINTILGNADLDAQRTIMYEIGLQQAFTDNIAINASLFYRDIRNWVGTSPEINTVIPGTKYVKYVNRDYANVRGITLSFDKHRVDKLGISLDYTYQIAEGTHSNPEDAFNDARAGREPRKEVIPLNWDQTHTLNLSILYGNAGLIFRYGSGLPYTPWVVHGTRVGRSLATGLRDNSERRPSTLTVDFNYRHDVRVGKATASFIIRVLNLFDARNEYGVFTDTGRATYTLEERIAGAGAHPDWFVRPDFFSAPRQIQIGMSVGF